MAPATATVIAASTTAPPPAPPAPQLKSLHTPELASRKQPSNEAKKTAAIARCSHPVTIPCMKHTLAWLHSHNLAHHTIPSSFIQSLLHWFHHQPHNATPPLPLGWGSGNLTFSWSDRSFGVLNAPLYADIAVARRILAPGGWFATTATRSHRHEFAAWFAEFLDAVRTCDSLKHQLLAEKARLSSRATNVTTTYDRVRSIYDGARQLAQQNDVAAYGARLRQCLDEVDAVLRDEERAVADVNAATSTETLENAAFSMLFGRLGTHKRPFADDQSGLYLAKLMAWMRSMLRREDFDAFFQLLQPHVKEGLAKNWKPYARHIKRLEGCQECDAHDGASCCAGFTRSRAVSTDQSHLPPNGTR